MKLFENGRILCQLDPLEALEVSTRTLREYHKYIEQLEAIDPSKVTDNHRNNFKVYWDNCKETAAFIFGCDPINFIKFD